MGAGRRRAWRPAGRRHPAETLSLKSLRAPFGLSGAFLGLGLVLASRWEAAPDVLPQVTVGRFFLGLALASIALDLWRTRDMLRLPSRSGALLVLGLVGEGAVILVSIATRGQNSAGALYGYVEMALFAIAVLIVANGRPRACAPLLLCAALGALLGCLDALVVGNPLATLEGESGRLAGHYGNPNLLGFAGSLAVPIFVTLAIRSRRGRAACLVAVVILLAAIFVSYSRSSLLGTGAGVIASIALAQTTTRRRVQAAVAGCALCGAIGAVGYAPYEQLRTQADFGLAANAPYRSGWDPSAQGFIAAGPSRLSNPHHGVLQIAATRAEEGASLPLGDAHAGQTYFLSFVARAPVKGIDLAYGLEDNRRDDGPPARFTVLTPRPTRLASSWTPTLDATEARVYFWLPSGGRFTLSGLSFGNKRGRLKPLSLQLIGRTNTSTSNESRFIHSREDAAHLAVDLFIQNPLTGIGWEQFTHYSQTRLHYGALATHNEYLRYAAELGLPGLLFLALIIAAVGGSAVRIRPTDVRVAAVACLISGAVGLCFLNGLETPALSLPLSVSAALLCAWPAGRRVRRKA